MTLTFSNWRILPLLLYCVIGLTPTNTVASGGAAGIAVPKEMLPCGKGSSGLTMRFAAPKTFSKVLTNSESRPVTWTPSAIEPPEARVISPESSTLTNPRRPSLIWNARTAASASNPYDSRRTVFPRIEGDWDSSTVIASCWPGTSLLGARFCSSFTLASLSPSADLLAFAASSFAVSPAAFASAIRVAVSNLYRLSSCCDEANSCLWSLTTAQVAMPTIAAANAAIASDPTIRFSHPGNDIPNIRLTLFEMIALSVIALSYFGLLFVGVIAFWSKSRRRSPHGRGSNVL